MEEKKNKEVRLKREAKEFKKFAFKDDMLTLAIGVVIGSAFKDLIDSLVKNIITPPIAFLTSKIDFSNMFFVLGDKSYDTLQAAEDASAVVIKYGLFINTFISFLITAVVIYIFVYKISQNIKKEKKKVERNTRKCPYCYSDISNKASRCPYCTSSVKPIS